MTKEEILYISQMEAWLKEQGIMEGQLRRAITYHAEIAKEHLSISELNREQLEAHIERVRLGRQEFENWKKDNGIGGAD